MKKSYAVACSLILLAVPDLVRGQEPSQAIRARPEHIEHMRAAIPMLVVRLTPLNSGEPRWGPELTIDKENYGDFVKCKQTFVQKFKDREKTVPASGIRVKKTCKFYGPVFSVHRSAELGVSTWHVMAGAPGSGARNLDSGPASQVFKIPWGFRSTHYSRLGTAVLTRDHTPETYWIVVETVDAATGQIGPKTNAVRVNFFPDESASSASDAQEALMGRLAAAASANELITDEPLFRLTPSHPVVVPAGTSAVYGHYLEFLNPSYVRGLDASDPGGSAELGDHGSVRIWLGPIVTNRDYVLNISMSSFYDRRMHVSSNKCSVNFQPPGNGQAFWVTGDQTPQPDPGAHQLRVVVSKPPGVARCSFIVSAPYWEKENEGGSWIFRSAELREKL